MLRMGLFEKPCPPRDIPSMSKRQVVRSQTQNVMSISPKKREVTFLKALKAETYLYLD